MNKTYHLTDPGDLLGYSTNGWFSGDSSLASLFYQIFHHIPSMQMLPFMVERSAVDALRERYAQEEAFDCFESTCYHSFENEKEDEYDEDDRDENGAPKEIYNCILICKPDLLIGYFDEKIRITYAGISREELDEIRTICEQHKKDKKKLDNLFIVTYSHSYFSLEQSRINPTDLHIERHYNDDFLPVAADIEQFIFESERSGLIILHGKQGTGKTTYIRHLINMGRKKMIYMGGDLVDKLADPSFVTFIRQQKNAVLIVEDCEELLASRNGSQRVNSGLVNILNISDGLLGDELCIKFICTFNAPLKDIDQALLRKGRLAARYEFRELCTEKVNSLIATEGLDIPPQTAPMTLAEIYNYQHGDYALNRPTAGFR